MVGNAQISPALKLGLGLLIACFTTAASSQTRPPAQGKSTVLTRAAASSATPAPFAPPPRTIADITDVLEKQKPDAKLIAKLRADAQAMPPARGSRAALSKFYYDRAVARVNLGRNAEARADVENAIRVGEGAIDSGELGRLRSLLAAQYLRDGDPKAALALSLKNIREVERELVLPGSKGRGWLFANYTMATRIALQIGEFGRAENYVRRNEALLRSARSWPSYPQYRIGWQVPVLNAKARLAEARGLFAEAERQWRTAETTMRTWVDKRTGLHGIGARAEGEIAIDQFRAQVGVVKARQGRIAEGEADVRAALLSRLRSNGKYNTQTAAIILQLAGLLVEQGRHAEAVTLVRATLQIYDTLGVPANGQTVVEAQSQLASILNLQGQWDEAAKVYAQIEQATAAWEQARRDTLALDSSRVATLYNTNNLAAGIAAAERLLSRQVARFGELHVETAVARGTLAIGLARAGRDAEAMTAFQKAIPAIMAAPRATDVDDAVETAARDQRMQLLAESYIGLLARSGAPRAAEESFALADTIRGRSVQKALLASSSRAFAGNSALAELVRRGQDLDQQLSAQIGVLNNALALPPEQRDDAAIKTLQGEIDKLRTARDAIKREISGKFRDYASLVEPQPPSADDIRAILRDDEALVSFYLGEETSFVWSVRKSGPVAFATLRTARGALNTKVEQLRQALEPRASLVSDIPPFDVALAHELYATLLQPVEEGWKGAKSLIVSTNGALGLLPLGLLVTQPATLKQGADAALFSEYRDVAFLSRTHAVTLVPSAAAMRSLRALPPSSDKRERLIGFGDPLFSRAQEVPPQMADAGEFGTRSLPLKRRASPKIDGVDSAQLALLPRLPDTADELESIAIALQADPAKVLHLGKAANEQTIKGSDLSKYRILVFATHGLVPGELDGLHEPALALSAPEVAGVPGDGLLTMSEVLALKLDADWVVLSACNTGAGSGAGAEAASGLGRAFFYAGTRAILVTNWSVHSQSARELVSDLFARQATDKMLRRGEALRQAMMALLDGPGYRDDAGTQLFSYAHPLFWAPYSIIGDGG